jgi:hypothetical protein
MAGMCIHHEYLTCVETDKEFNGRLLIHNIVILNFVSAEIWGGIAQSV